tara:strand:- start:6963 stop:8030 length:1068 start_codon:yes stop_codon:yes gene_type:complete
LNTSTINENFIQTVCGLVKSENIGNLLPHEHILMDQSCLHKIPSQLDLKTFFYNDLTPETLGWIRHHNVPNIRNFKMTNIDTAISELKHYKKFGGDSIVDVTSIGLGRDPVGLAKISQATGVNVIAGTSYKKTESDKKQKKYSEKLISDEMIKEIHHGIDHTNIKAGIIGEIACDWPLNSENKKLLSASVNAQKITGAVITVHPGSNINSPQEIIKFLEQTKTNLNNVILNNLDKTIIKKEQFLEIANYGCYIGLDLFGFEKSFTFNYPKIKMPNDGRRMDIIEHLINNGFEDKILISQNISTQDRLLSYGGHGYFYILNHMVPRMKKRGFSESIINKLTQTNSQNAISFKKSPD